MSDTHPSSEAWKKMVLRSMPAPAWLEGEAPDSDVVISSRMRCARNLVGHRFPHHCSDTELEMVLNKILEAIKHPRLQLNIQNKLTGAERDFLLGNRLISVDFRPNEPGRALLTDEHRLVSIMVNEEDHLRIQALSPGWSISTGQAAVDHVIGCMEQSLDFMHDENLGYLTASPSNTGTAMRRSALFHLIALAHTKKLMSVLKALNTWGLTARGMFGESSRAVGAFFQVSTTHQGLHEFVGATEYLIEEERKARGEVSQDELTEKAEQARTFAQQTQEISLSDALRVLAWMRWAAAKGIKGFPLSQRTVDEWISYMEVHGTQDQRIAAKHRAVFLKDRSQADTEY
jgi:protein arginine kinase